MTNSQKTSDLKRLAYECTERKYSVCNNNCVKCPLNTSLYLEDPREAVLIQTNSELDYQQNAQYQNEQIQRQIEYQKQENSKNIGKLIGNLLAIFLFIVIPIMWIGRCVNKCSSSVSMNLENNNQSQLTYNIFQSNVLMRNEQKTINRIIKIGDIL